MLNAHSISANHSTFNSAGRDIVTVNIGTPRCDDRQERRTIAHWLSPLNFKASQNAFLETREEDTGNWLLESQTFKDWRDNHAESLWCSGNPGAGKTVLVSIVVEHLQTLFRNDNVGVACIYCNYKEQGTQTTPNLVGSILKQLVQDRGAISKPVESFYNYHQDRGTQPTLNELIKVLEAEVRTYYRVFLLVDALDECMDDGTRAKLLRALSPLAGYVNLMVTSRDLPSIEQYFRNTKRLQIRAHDEDVKKYVENLLLDHPELKSLREMIKIRIVENARGMFLLARLHMNKLVQQNNDKEVLRALENLPEGIDDIYNDAMERIDQQTEVDRQLAKRVLAWITHARRPLIVEELQHALAVSPTMTEMDPGAVVYETKLTSVCAGLVVVDGQRIIRLAHYTTQQYFEDRRESLLPNADANIATTCLTYLAFDSFGCGYRCDDDKFESLLADHPLLDYAAQHWGHHSSRQDENIQRLALRFLQDDQKVACASQVMLVDPQYGCVGYTQRFPRDCSSIHIAAYFGLERIAHRLVGNGANPDSKNSHGQTPLILAAVHGYSAVVELLLAHDDVDADSEDINGLTPLLFAVRNGHDAVVKLLLARNCVDANLMDDAGWVPLSFAASNGYEAVVKSLLAHEEIEVNSKDSWNRTPLSLAALNGHTAVVKLLLARDDIEADPADVNGSTPLLLAASNGHKAVVKLLLSRNDVKPDSKGEFSRTALSFAACDGHTAVVRLLLTCKDVQVDLVDRDGRTPLSFAASNGHESTVEVLLGSNGINVDSRDLYGRTSLSFAASNGHDRIVKLLLACHNVDVNAKDNDGQTALSFSAKNGHDTVVKLLLACDDIKPDCKDNSNHTPLWYAAKNGHDRVVKPLLACSDVKANLKGWLNRTPLLVAASNGHDRVVKLLLDRENADADSKDHADHTPLSLAASNGHEAVVKMLLPRRDVDVNSRNHHGRTPLSFAASNGREAIVALLLARDDVKVNLADHDGRSPLFFASSNGREGVVRLMLACNDVEVNSTDHGGRTQLWHAIKNKHEGVVKLLQAHQMHKAVQQMPMTELATLIHHS